MLIRSSPVIVFRNFITSFNIHECTFQMPRDYFVIGEWSKINFFGIFQGVWRVALEFVQHLYFLHRNGNIHVQRDDSHVKVLRAWVSHYAQ